MNTGFLTLQILLSPYVEGGHAWAQQLSSGIAAADCRRCRAARAWVAATILDGLSDRPRLRVMMDQTSMRHLTRQAGLDPEWLFREVRATEELEPVEPGLLGFVRQQIFDSI